MILLAPAPAVALHIQCTAGAVVQVALSLHATFSCHIDGATPTIKQNLVRWLLEYAEKKPGPLPSSFSLEGLSPFQKRVLEKMGNIPFGEAKSYRELATLSGNPKASRAVGGACNKNPFPLFFPCHRIIQSDGSLGGFAGGGEIKRRLLAFERNYAKNTHSF